MNFIPLFFLSAAAASAAVTSNYPFSSGLPVPDNNINGLADSREITDTIGPLLYVTVTLQMTGGWNGDLYAYLVHDTGFTVLLNRLGRTTTDTVGSGTSGLNITFDDRATGDPHTSLHASGTVSGSFQPDARTEDPATVTSTSVRSAFLHSFTGLEPNGRWTLFVADLSAGGTATLENWTLHLTSIPEPHYAMPSGFAALLYGIRRQRNLCSPSKSKK
jgi:subtilisin-like proprotein convertase family protein